jgi:hypothetical protein
LRNGDEDSHVLSVRAVASEQFVAAAIAVQSGVAVAIAIFRLGVSYA